MDCRVTRPRRGPARGDREPRAPPTRAVLRHRRCPAGARPVPGTRSTGAPRSRVRRRPWPPVLHRVDERRTRASAPTRGPATVRRPPRRSVAPPRPREQAGPALPSPGGSDPGGSPSAGRMPCPVRSAAGQAAGRHGRRKDCTAGADSRTRAPSPTRRPQRAPPGRRRRDRPKTGAGLSCRCRPRRVAPGPGCGRPAPRSAAGSRCRTRAVVPAAPAKNTQWTYRTASGCR